MSVSTDYRKVSIALLVAECITVVAPVAILGKFFNFPDILRQPAANAFALFHLHTTPIIIGYYVFLISSLLYIPLSYALTGYLEAHNAVGQRFLVGLGIATAVFQAIGFVRWIFTMPYLTDTYYAHPELKDTVTTIYEMLNRYAGMSIGEHLGFIAMGAWTIVLSWLLLQSPLKRWLGYLGIVIGALLIVSVAEHFGGPSAPVFAQLSFIGNTLWSIWLLVIAFYLFIAKRHQYANDTRIGRSDRHGVSQSA